MRTAVGIDLRTGSWAIARDDGTSERIAPEGITNKPDAIALVTGTDLDPSPWRVWAAQRFEMQTLEVAEEIARRHAADAAEGAAKWALGQRTSGIGAAPLSAVPTLPSPNPASQSTLSDFGDGRSMSDFGEGQSMSDFAEPSHMGDFGEGQSMSDFGEGQSMADFGGARAEPPPQPPTETTPTPPPKRVRKVQIAAAAAVVVAVVAVAAVVFASSGSEPEEEVPVAASATTTEPETTTSSRAIPAERKFDVTFTITSTNADAFPGAPLRTGLTGAAIVTLSCEAETCRFELKATDGAQLGLVVATSSFDGSSLEGVRQTNDEPQGPGACPRLHTQSVRGTVTDNSISGEAAFNADPIVCPGPARNTVHVYTLTFEGTEAATSAGGA